MRHLFITATGTNVGKTYTTLKLIESISKSGLKVGVFKPIETGVVDIAPDATLLLEACQKQNSNFSSLKVEDIVAYTFPLPSAPFCADIDKTIDVQEIAKKFNHLSTLCDILLVEGAGGLMVPIKKDFFMVDLIKTLEIDTLLVTPSRLGCINDTLLSISCLRGHNISFKWCVNIHEDTDSFSKVTQPFYDEVFPDWLSVDTMTTKNLELF